MIRQPGIATCSLVVAHYHSNRQDKISEKAVWGKKDVGPTCGFAASTEVGPRATVGTMQTGFPVYKLQIKTKTEVCNPAPPRVP
jgi:hypothetical protein